MSRAVSTHNSPCGNHQAIVYRDTGAGCFYIKLFSFGAHVAGMNRTIEGLEPASKRVADVMAQNVLKEAIQRTIRFRVHVCIDGRERNYTSIAYDECSKDLLGTSREQEGLEQGMQRWLGELSKWTDTSVVVKPCRPYMA